MSVKHKVFYRTLRFPVILYLKLKFGYKYEKARELPENYIVLSNHTTDFDPLFVAASFNKQMYFVASEHITRWKKLYAFLRFAFAPIIRFKATVAGSTVLQILRKTKHGDNVCVFAEGVRSWDGVTGEISASTSQLVKRAGCGLVTYRIVGGYHISPVWASGKCRKGRVCGEIAGVYTKEQIAAMDVEEIDKIINRDLYVNAFEVKKGENGKYRGKNMAEGLERFIYRCPDCGALNCMYSSDNTLSCSSCGKSFSYDNTCLLDGNTLKALGDEQFKKTQEDACAGLPYIANEASMYIIDKKSSRLVAKGELCFSNEEISCGAVRIPLSEVGDMAIHGNSSLVFARGSEYYELNISLPDSAYRFLSYYKAICAKGDS